MQKTKAKKSQNQADFSPKGTERQCTRIHHMVGSEICVQHLGLPFYGVHTFRHLNASLQINAGIDAVTVSATLGHSTSTTTLNIYSHCFEENKTKSVDIVNTALGGFI